MYAFGGKRKAKSTIEINKKENKNKKKL